MKTTFQEGLPSITLSIIMAFVSVLVVVCPRPTAPVTRGRCVSLPVIVRLPVEKTCTVAFRCLILYVAAGWSSGS